MFNCAKPLLELRRRSLPRTERIAPVTQRDSPISDSAGGIACQSFLESLNGVGELKRMHEGHGSIELWLCYAAARGLEIDDSQVLVRRMLPCLRKSCMLGRETEQRNNETETQCSHLPSPQYGFQSHSRSSRLRKMLLKHSFVFPFVSFVLKISKANHKGHKGSTKVQLSLNRYRCHHSSGSGALGAIRIKQILAADGTKR